MFPPGCEFRGWFAKDSSGEFGVLLSRHGDGECKPMLWASQQNVKTK
jgi:hypothetical protein